MATPGVDAVLDREFDALKLDVQPEFTDEQLLAQKYPARAHVRKVVDELRKADTPGVDKAIIYLPGEPTRLYEDSDMGPEFRQRRYFYYITGVDYADCAVTYEVVRDRLTLWIPYVEPRQALYYGSVPDAASMAAKFDVDRVCYAKDLQSFLESKMRPSRTFFLLHQDKRVETMLLAYKATHFTDAQTMAPPPDAQQPSKCRGPTVNWWSLQPAMDRARVIKDAHEVALIRRANAISSTAHRQVAAHLLRMRNEQDVEAALTAACTARGAHRQAYHIIAGAGANAATLHYDANDAPLRAGQVLVVDAGCEFRCYASDITRSLPISGAWGPYTGAVHAIVQRMQDAAIAAVRPGIVYRDLHLLAARIATDGLIDLGILRGPSREDIHASRVVSAFFPHGLGHHVGLECHDVSGDEHLLLPTAASDSIPAVRTPVLGAAVSARPSRRQHVSHQALVNLSRAAAGQPARGVSALAKSQTLQPGMVVTIEPGLYFNRDYIHGNYLSNPGLARFIDTDVLAKYYAVGGVRIEDDILVTKDGYENLTTAPKGDELLDVINGTYEFV